MGSKTIDVVKGSDMLLYIAESFHAVGAIIFNDVAIIGSSIKVERVAVHGILKDYYDLIGKDTNKKYLQVVCKNEGNPRTTEDCFMVDPDANYQIYFVGGLAAAIRIVGGGHYANRK